MRNAGEPHRTGDPDNVLSQVGGSIPAQDSERGPRCPGGGGVMVTVVAGENEPPRAPLGITQRTLVAGLVEWAVLFNS